MSDVSERYAVYLTPPPSHELTQLAAEWLGRNPWNRQRFAPFAPEGISAEEMWEATAAPRHYGFHATLRAPFELTCEANREALNALVSNFCTNVQRLNLTLRVEPLGPFLALQAEHSRALQQLESELLSAIEPFRKPLSEFDRLRRLKAPLTERQKQSLKMWGYPYVGADFRFHMTLTGALSNDRRNHFEAAANLWFAEWLEVPLDRMGVAVFHQPDRQTPFQAIAFHSFAKL